jgi:hypothetical protein
MTATEDSREYNRVYEHLVEAEDDVIGLVAYSIYKQDKRDFLIEWRRRHGGSPAADQLNVFTVGVLTPGQQQRYRSTARNILDAYAKTAVEAERPLIQRSAITERIESAARAVERSARWYRQVPAGIASALIYTLLLIAILLILRYAGVDLVGILEQIGQHTPAPPTTQVAQP